MTILPTYDNPHELGKPLSAYTHVARAGNLVFVAGQCGIDKDNSVTGPDVTSQTYRAYENITKALISQGSSLLNVVRFVTYLVSADDVAEFYAARQAFFAAHYPNGQYPPNTLLIVQGLVRPDLRVEIDATAYRG
ncbi:RidA family protein [Mycobacterium sp. 21AC1]|uniref:RidA family protein n=1 Tax=[Mycobacterium] appelbergii TaxID=2939269 RepID=UPI0029393A2D|nr:RidA family protein [Mycobacterium sp. 21AC1]MDV3130249.1 RidA family protein [Mycobacterium sp. 21AC1]